MIKITVSSVDFNYEENDEIENVTVFYRGQTEDYNHSINGSLNVSKADYDAVVNRPNDLVTIVRDFLVESLKEEPEDEEEEEA